MKFVGYLNAVAAWKEVPEEISPERGVVIADLVQGVRQRYGFQAFPQLSPVELPQTLTFMGGKYTPEGEKAFAVGMLLMEPDGDIVQTMTTDQGDQFLDDLIPFLDESVGYRLGQSTKQKLYASNLVVEFDVQLETSFGKINRIIRAINSATPGRPPVNLKRLAFGTVNHPLGSQMAALEAADFLIERRVGTPFEANRYYCSAPMRTQDHLALLKEIEAIASSN